jgi:glycosyltransferase involved in cell wall biosynthesis
VAEKRRVAIVMNSPPSGVLAPRAIAFSRGLTPEFRVEILWRESARLPAIRKFLEKLRDFRPDVLYSIDLGYPVVIACLLYRAMTSCPLVIETGDPLAELLWAAGRVGRVGRFAIRRYEQAALKRADHVVVRGSGLREYLLRLGVTRVAVVPDGVDTGVFHPMEVPDLRRALGMDGSVSIGVMGSLNWSERLRWGYGCELIEALVLLKELPVCGIVLGDGPGRKVLERKAVEGGVGDRIRFLGHVSQDLLPSYINTIDICLSTQTNDWIGRARTTAKLPLFLACGRFVLASRVGEAARVLPDEMLVDYAEGFDPSYPERLAQRIERLVSEPRLLRLGEHSRRIAESQFNYNFLVPRVAEVLRSVVS